MKHTPDFLNQSNKNVFLILVSSILYVQLNFLIKRSFFTHHIMSLTILVSHTLKKKVTVSPLVFGSETALMFQSIGSSTDCLIQGDTFTMSDKTCSSTGKNNVLNVAEHSPHPQQQHKLSAVEILLVCNCDGYRMKSLVFPNQMKPQMLGCFILNDGWTGSKEEDGECLGNNKEHPPSQIAATVAHVQTIYISRLNCNQFKVSLNTMA